MKKTLSTMAAAAMLMASTAIAPAFAQTAAPSTPAPAQPAAPADPAKPMDNNAAAPAAGDTAANAASSGSYLTEQSETQISANDYIGKSVYNAENESIGDVNDLIIEENGGVVAAVIGVGGFLGIGEKNVAVPMDKIDMAQDTENNDVRLTTTETAEALKAAPEFMTLDDQQAEQDATTTSSTTTPAGGATTPSTAPKN
jgi:sporulation protein YlmC with PRC-barrel domain